MGLTEELKKELPEKAYYPVGGDSDVLIYYPRFNNKPVVSGIHLALKYAMNKFEVKKAQIICFGNNLYGKEINYIWDNGPDIHIDLMVCDPNAELIRESDRAVLDKKINEAKKNENTAVYVSKLPPTLRSCILFNEGGEPLLCCVQYYLLSTYNRNPGYTGRETPCIIACSNEGGFPLWQYVEFCSEEFSRLKKAD